jgi:hypothetical protein
MCCSKDIISTRRECSEIKNEVTLTFSRREGIKNGAHRENAHVQGWPSAGDARFFLYLSVFSLYMHENDVNKEQIPDFFATSAIP